MRYQRTQIYLDPEEHRKLIREAQERGISLAAYLREIVAGRTGEQAPAYGNKSWDGFMGMYSAGPVRQFDDPDEEVSEAIDWNYRRKMGLLDPTDPNDRDRDQSRRGRP